MHPVGLAVTAPPAVSSPRRAPFGVESFLVAESQLSPSRWRDPLDVARTPPMKPSNDDESVIISTVDYFDGSTQAELRGF